MISAKEIEQRDDDTGVYMYSTRGEVARSTCLELFRDHPSFQEPDDAIFLLDLDMRHPPDLLERLRAHDLDMVTAHYYRREIPLFSVCAWLGDGQWPYPPMLYPPESGMHEIGTTGMGCVLIKRKVIKKVWDMLPDGDNPFFTRALPQYSTDQRKWGSDFSFFTLARSCGFKLWLDASLECKHADIIWLGKEYKDKLFSRDKNTQILRTYWLKRMELHGMDEESINARIGFLTNEHNRLLDQLRAGAAEVKEINKKLQVLHQQRLKLVGQITECQSWLGGGEEVGGETNKLANINDRARTLEKELEGIETVQREHTNHIVDAIDEIQSS